MSTKSERGAEHTVALLIALVPYLNEVGRVSVEEAAAHFGVTPARMRTAVNLIGLAGIPDAQGFVMPYDMFGIDYDDLELNDSLQLTNSVGLESNPRLAPREAAALIAGLELLATVHSGDLATLRGLQDKLRVVAGSEQERVVVGPSRNDAIAASIRDAIERHVVVSLDYRKPGSATEERTIAPVLLEITDGEAFIRAWDLDRGAERSFRLDRCVATRATATAFPEEARELHPGARMFSDDGAETIIEVEASPAAAAMLADYAHDSIRREDGKVRLFVKVANPDSLIRAVAGLAGEAHIVAPSSVRETMLAWLRRAKRPYEDEGL
ncbi:helix-turn-helix transcriptional regulator [Humidisolicoccus flavus]|uniref:helix-turn-helix transcriptional regulator n=1 Tax=Humidisolicoccus flavus TaxID=3111414 RepID=UPI003246C9DD